MDQDAPRKVNAAHVVEIQSTLGIRQRSARCSVWPLCVGDVVQPGHSIVSNPDTIVFVELIDRHGDIPHI